MKGRICGSKNISISKRRKIMKKINNIRIDDNNQIINIGINFHICYENFNENTVLDDINYSIDILNNDFNKKATNFDQGKDIYIGTKFDNVYDKYISLADKCNINFYLVDIIYKPLPFQNGDNIDILDISIKGKSPAITPNKYLNIWIVDIAGGLLGYAQFPWDKNPETDGVVIAKGTFGENPSYQGFDLNKTMTHEIGHWLGLYHTFQDTFNYDGGAIDYRDGRPNEEIQEMKGDCVVDTPPQRVPTYGNPFSNPKKWPASVPYDDNKSYYHMFMNFMDYSDDIAMFMFTHDQAIKIRLMINIYRKDILNNVPTEPILEPLEPILEPILEPEEPILEPEEPILEPSEPISDNPIIDEPILEPEEPISDNPIVEEPISEPSEPITKPSNSIIGSILDFFPIHGCIGNKDDNNIEAINKSSWTNGLQIVRNNFLKTHAKITHKNSYTGKKCLRTKKNGMGELKFHIDKNFTEICLRVKTNNPDTYICILPPGAIKWFGEKLDISDDYEKYKFLLPKPMVNTLCDTYLVRLGTLDSHKKYAYFDDVIIT